MRKFLFLLLLGFSLSSCHPKEHDKDKIANLIDNWHQAASDAQLESYFGMMSKNAIYIGTDPGERWTKDEFYGFCKPYFDKGKAWDFKAFDRKIYSSEDAQSIWFDELLNTWMGVCRGSGVIVMENGEYKISHYHLSVTIKNEKIKDFLQINQ